MAFNYLNLVGNAELVKQLNYAMIYRLIVQQSPISRIQLAEVSHLAPASITKITRQLLKHKLIKEIDVQQSTGGRPAVSIVARTAPFQAIAIQFSRSRITIGLYDLGGELLASEYYPLNDFTQRLAENYLLSVIELFLQENSKKIKKLVAISVVMPGLIDSESGVVRYTPHVKVDNWPLVDVLSVKFGVPAFIGNDVQSLALAENYFGSTQDVDDSILIRVHRGVGSGVVINQQLFQNHNQSTGEVGHIQVELLGDRCHCGNFGCLENTVVNKAIEQRARQLLEQNYPSKLTLENCNIKEISRLANEGDELAVHLIQQAGHNLGRAIAILVNLFNPQKIVIAGEITVAEKVLFPILNSVLNSQALKTFRDNLKIGRSVLDDTSAIGAFALVQQAMFNGSLLMTLLSEEKE
ncbi:ROK family protein [Zophobihabitans entericus]|uniref:ROK family protein n=1 Tax=Zophobihabitans entericus TaxID=1635327 RepID=A0A6G9I8W9_9GAMM|nr:ROK family protein [Zophobihabitans entericus]QIQ20668.1 ROK family protein [Zophobihabitans entericus]